ncbi:hypothetical protein [Paracraurococcus ruber]|nr:hypothetical protein [Paracraurococcus ruber]
MPSETPPAGPDQATDEDRVARRCVLQHAVFNRVANVCFRRSPTDGEAVMVVPFGDREASLPLRGVQKEFDIPDDSEDGRMIGLIIESLGYVTALHPGDPLPAEVVNGQASWTPGGNHQRRAQVRLRVALLAWHDGDAARRAMRDIESGGRLDTDPELKTAFQNAGRKAMVELGCASPEEVMQRVDGLASDFAYIEALRDRLLVRIQALVLRVRRIAGTLHRSDSVRSDAVARIVKMAGTSLEELGARFDKVDEVCRDIIALLREPELRLAFVHESRDLLYRNLLGWDSILNQWDEADEDEDGPFWQVVANTYQFLARRYLPATEWPSFTNLRGSLSKSNRNIMRW